MRSAERKTGLSDWGTESQDFRPGLNALMESLEHDAELNTLGRVMMRSYVQRLLENRLKIARDLREHAEIHKVEIRRPLFIVGFPRTGSTLLQRLLARDPGVRSLQTWEMMLPSPPPETASYASDPRIKISDRRVKALNWMAPEFAIAHELVAGEPEECVSLLQTSLVNSSFELMARIPGYRRWLLEQDQHAPYRYYRQQLQLLQWKHPKDHWVLKSPFHLLGIEALMDVFPDAVIVQTHRDPARVMPSLCSLFNVMHQLTSDQADPKQLGPSMLELLGWADDRAIDLRERIGDERFFDVSYRDLVSDPFETVRSIYTRFGYSLSAEAVTAMQAWHRENQQHKHGVHRYSLEMFGLSTEMVERRFARYNARFKDYL